MHKRVIVTNECPTYWWRSHKIIADQGQTKLSFPPKIGNIFGINIMCLIAVAYYPDKVLVSLSRQMNPINVYKLGTVDKEMFNACPSSWYCLSAILFNLVHAFNVKIQEYNTKQVERLQQFFISRKKTFMMPIRRFKRVFSISLAPQCLIISPGNILRITFIQK